MIKILRIIALKPVCYHHNYLHTRQKDETKKELMDVNEDCFTVYQLGLSGLCKEETCRALYLENHQSNHNYFKWLFEF